MTINLSNEARKEITDILALHESQFGGKVEHLTTIINGGYDINAVDKSLKKVIRDLEVATQFGMNVLASKKRKREIVNARQFSMYQIYNEFHHKGYTLGMIGDIFKRDHSTVIHSVKTVRILLSVNDPLMTKLNERYEQVKN